MKCPKCNEELVKHPEFFKPVYACEKCDKGFFEDELRQMGKWNEKEQSDE